MSDSQHTSAVGPVKMTREQQRSAAQAVASYCLLPDPRPYFPNTQTWEDWAVDKLTTSSNELNVKDCTRRQINGKIPDNQELPRNDPRYNAIIRDAARRAAAGTAQCQWREFDDAQDEPYKYSGQVVDGKCRPVRIPR